MDPRIRFVPLLALLGLVVARVVNPNILGGPVVEGWPITWWWVIFVPLLWISAIIISPPAVRFLTFVGGRWFLPPIVFIILLVGLLWALDLLWTLGVSSWCDTCPESRLLPTMTGAVFGTSPEPGA